MEPLKDNNMIHINNKDFEELVAFVYKKYGIDLSRKRQLVEGRLTNTLRAKGISTFSDYLKELYNDKTGEEIHLFLNKITTNHSYFARENNHFDFLLQNALPTLEQIRTKELRIWSAGCSAGQEPYNIAMTIDQYFGMNKNAWDTTILATDISTSVLEKAHRGIYPADNLKDIPPTWRTKYFKALDDGNYEVVDKIKKEVVFRMFNLMDTFKYTKPFDIIFCRNVMIYFDAETTVKLIDKFYEATAEGGYLFIGHSESINKDRTNYTYLRPATYQKITRKGTK